MEEYEYFSEEDGNKLVSFFEDMAGKLYKHHNSKIYEISFIGLMPANPTRRDEIWNMMLDYYNGRNNTTIEHIESNLKYFNESEYVVSLISKELSSNLHPEFQIHHLRQVIDENGQFAYGFGIVLEG